MTLTAETAPTSDPSDEPETTDEPQTLGEAAAASDRQPKPDPTSDYGVALIAMRTTLREFTTVDVDAFTNTERSALLGVLHTIGNLTSALQYPLIAANEHHSAYARATPRSASPAALTTHDLDTTLKDARLRHRRAEQFFPAATPTGHRQPPQHPRIVAAVVDGHAGDDKLDIIDKFWAYLDPEDAVDRTELDNAMNALGDMTRTLLPHQLQQAAKLLTEYLLPDGKPGDTNAREAYLTLGKQGEDTLSSMRGLVSAELRALIEAIIAKEAAPGANLPETTDGETTDTETSDADNTRPAKDNSGENDHDPAQTSVVDLDDDPDPDSDEPAADHDVDPTKNATDTPTSETPSPAAACRAAAATLDLRSPGQRRHDALTKALHAVLAAKVLGTHRGLPVGPIVSIPLDQLENQTGYVLTGTGTRMKVRDAIRMLARTRPYLLVFDKHKHRPLYLGRAKRIATLDQRLALAVTDRGCTRPDCSNPPAYCEVHHRTRDWADDGLTDITDLTLACPKHHRDAGNGPDQHTTSIAGDDHPFPGRTVWHHNTENPDTSPGQINHTHHPEDHFPDGYLDGLRGT